MLVTKFLMWFLLNLKQDLPVSFFFLFFVLNIFFKNRGFEFFGRGEFGFLQKATTEVVIT